MWYILYMYQKWDDLSQIIIAQGKYLLDRLWIATSASGKLVRPCLCPACTSRWLQSSFQRPSPRSEDVRQARGRYWESARVVGGSGDGKEEGLVTKASVSVGRRWCWIFEGCSTGQNPHLTLGNAGDSLQDNSPLWEKENLHWNCHSVAQLRVIQLFWVWGADADSLGCDSNPV